jgi:hypothetical protein
MPIFLYLKLAAIAGLLAWGAFGHWKASSIARDWESAKVAQANSYIRGVEKLHEDHDAKLAERERTIHATAKQLELERARRATDVVVADSVRDLIAAAVARAKTGSTAPVAAGAAADGLGLVAEQCVKRIEELAGRARESLIAHRQCAAEYEVMRQKAAVK